MGSYPEVIDMHSVLAHEKPSAYDNLSSCTEPLLWKLPHQHWSQAKGLFTSSLVSASEPLLKDKTWKRTPAFPIEKLPIHIPLAQIDDSIDHAAIVTSCLDELNKSNLGLFAETAIWRDLYAMTGILRTFNGSNHITSVWKELSESHHPSNFALKEGSSKVIHMDNQRSWIQARFTFETAGQPETLCSGQIGIKPGESSCGWEIWLLTTILEEIKGFHNPDFWPPGTEEKTKSRTPGMYKLADYDCVVVGAGFAGLCLSARLKAIGVHYLTLERNQNVGDNWTNRYDSARFHTSKDYSEMPIERIFKEEDPYFLSGADLAGGYQKYSDKHNLNIWCSTSLESADFNEETNIWTLTIDRAGKKIAIKTPHFVLAIGAGGSIPKMPQYPGREQFRGTVIHSVSYKNANQWKGKVGIIVGTANTAHDVAEDMVDAGMTSVTMIQRSRTCVFPIEYYKKWSDPIYNPTSSIEEADRITMATPIAVTRQLSMHGSNALAEKDSERFDALERAGFRVERFGDLWKLLSERLGGHYMDVGASKRIAAGEIKVKGNAAITGYTATGLVFSDCSKLHADVIVFCTGFSHDVLKEAIKFVGEKIGENLDDYWDIDEEGELRGVYKPHGVPGIWYHGGGVTYARFFSRFLALQIKADTTGTPLKRYTKKPE